jgi:luciferase family oxidoreductase group 1
LAKKNTTEGQAIKDSISTAQLADRLGYERYWLTEHHSCLLDSCPEILLPLLAATTQRIKVGTAGILLNYYSPYKVAKTFLFLSTMFPGRIDLGVCAGQVSGTAMEVFRASRDMGFDELNECLRNYLRLGLEKLSPLERSEPPHHWIVGSSWRSMNLAAKLGASYCYSLCHSQSDANPLVLSAFRSKIKHQVESGQLPGHAILVAGICAATDVEAAAMLAEHKNVYLIPTIAGTPRSCQSELLRLAEIYCTSHIVWMDLSPTQEQAEGSLTLLSEVMGLRKFVNN